jgi:glycosyltransferase involved in cell wall biosynthesis
MLKYGIDAHYLDGFYQGVKSLLDCTVKEMSSMGKGNIYLYHRQTQSVKKSEGSIIHKPLFTNAGQFNYIAGFPYVVFRDKIDLFQSHYILPFWLPCARVVGIYDILYERFPEHFGKLHSLQMKTLVPRSAYYAHRVITISEFTKSEIVNKYGVKPEKIAVINCGVSKDFKVLSDSEAHGTLIAMGIRQPYLLCVGRMAPIKNMTGMLRAFDKIAQANKDLGLVVVGPNDPTFIDNNLGKQLAEMQGLRDRIVFTGPVNQDQLIALYNGTTLFVFPSFGEGFGIPVLEAMACGAPVLCSNATALPEVAGKVAETFDPFDQEEFNQKLAALLRDTPRMEQMGRDGPAWAGRFTWRRAAEQTLEVYRQAYDESR